jgi:hypothetical protein
MSFLPDCLTQQYIILMGNDRNHLRDIEPIIAWRYFALTSTCDAGHSS